MIYRTSPRVALYCNRGEYVIVSLRAKFESKENGPWFDNFSPTSRLSRSNTRLGYVRQYASRRGEVSWYRSKKMHADNVYDLRRQRARNTVKYSTCNRQVRHVNYQHRSRFFSSFLSSFLFSYPFSFFKSIRKTTVFIGAIKSIYKSKLQGCSKRYLLYLLQCRGRL